MAKKPKYWRGVLSFFVRYWDHSGTPMLVFKHDCKVTTKDDVVQLAYVRRSFVAMYLKRQLPRQDECEFAVGYITISVPCSTQLMLIDMRSIDAQKALKPGYNGRD